MDKQLTETVRVASRPHPFRMAETDFNLPEGNTLLEILEIVQPDELLRRHAHIFIGDRLVSRSDWQSARPAAGELVSIRILPQGGDGKSPLRTLLTIGILAASFAFAGPLGTSIVGAESFSLFGLSVSSSVFGGAIISLGGTLLLNAIAPIRPPSINDPGVGRNDAESPSYFLDKARNSFRPYAPIPVIFGRHRVVPPLGAAPVTEVVGDSNHLRMIVVWGYGPLRVSDIRIGNTPIGNFDDVRMETLEGRSTDPDITLYPGDIDQQNLAVTLTHEAGWITRRSVADADELSVDISLPRGLAQFNDNGKRISHSVILQIQYRQVGDAAWLAPQFTTLTGGMTEAAGQVTLSGARTQPIRHGFRWSTGNRGTYDVRVRRVSENETESNMFSMLVWSALRTITDRAPVDFPGHLAITAIDIRASDQLSGVISDLNGIVECEARDWNGAAWVPAYTRNPASMFRLALESPARRMPAPQAEIDLPALQDFHDFCETNDFKFDYIQDTRRSIWDILSDICAAARASPTRIDDKWSVIVDDGEQPVRQHFTPVNSSRFELKRVYDPPPHGLRISFPNEASNWTRDERIVYNDGYGDANATNLPAINPVGITNGNHIWKFARFHLAQILLRRELWTLDVGFEYLVARRGSRVTVQHDVLVVGLASARVKSVTLDANGRAESVEIDSPIQFPEDGINYAAKIRTVADADLVVPLTVQGGPQTAAIDELIFTNPVDAAIDQNALISVGQAGFETIDGLLTAVNPSNEITARISIVPFQEGVYQADTGVIPPFDSGISPGLVRRPMVIESVISDMAALRRLGFGVESAILVLVRPIDNLSASIDTEIRAATTTEPYLPAFIKSRSRESVEIGNVETGITYDLRLRWSEIIDGERRFGTWTERTHTVGEIANMIPLATEDIYASTVGDAVPANQRPSNAWPYREPGIAGGLRWYLSGSGLMSGASPYLWLVQRVLRDFVEDGGDIPDDWGDPVLIGHFGQDGEDGLGLPGDPASRGPAAYHIPITVAQQASLSAAGQILPAEFVLLADEKTIGPNLDGDFVRFYRAGFNSWWTYDTGVNRWRRAAAFIGAAEIQAVNIQAITGDFGDLNVTGVLAAAHISADVRNWTNIWVGNQRIGSSGTITLEENPQDYDFLYFVGANWNTRHRWRSVTIPVSVLSASGTSETFESARDDEWRVNLSGRVVSFTRTAGGVSHDFYEIWGVSRPESDLTPTPDDTGLDIEDSSITVDEEGTTNIRVRLTAQPTEDVIVAATETDADISVAPGFRTFTAENWNNYQVFVVTGISDTDDMDEAATVTLTATGGLNEVAFVSVTIVDDDTPTSQAPGVPGTPTRTSRTTNSLTLACTAPTTGGVPTVYRWRYSPGFLVANNAPFVDSPGPDVTIPNLQEATAYAIDVRAGNVVGNSQYSSDFVTTTESSMPGAGSREFSLDYATKNETRVTFQRIGESQLIDPSLTVDNAYLTYIEIGADGSYVYVALATNAIGDLAFPAGQDFTPTFEAAGQLRFMVDGESALLTNLSDDLLEPYLIQPPSNASDFATLYDNAAAGAVVTVTLIP